MEIVGSVAPDEVPEGERHGRKIGVWSKVMERIMEDHAAKRVTVLRLKDDKEFKAMQNNLSPRFRETPFRLRPVVVRQGDEIRVFMELEQRENNK